MYQNSKQSKCIVVYKKGTVKRTCGPNGKWIKDFKFIRSVGCKDRRSLTEFIRYRNDLMLDIFKDGEDIKGIVKV